MKIFRLLLLTVSLSSLGLFLQPAAAAVLEGQHFEDRIRLADRELTLNGLGVRAVFIFKAYVAGLYLSDKATSAQEVLRNPGPRRLQLRMLIEAGAPEFRKALVDGLQKNASAHQWALLQDRAALLVRQIEQIGVARQGDSITLDYLPERGTSLAVNEVVKGPPIAGADFFNALLEIFVGDNPVDTRLRKGLLGL